MLKHCVVIPIIFLVFSLVFSFYNHDVISKEFGTRTNIFHDIIGGKILFENNIEFEKIVLTEGKDVFFCDSDETLVLFVSATKKEIVEKIDSSKCGKKYDNGTGKIFSDIFRTIKNCGEKKSSPSILENSCHAEKEN